MPESHIELISGTNITGTVQLPASKSALNRLLIIRYLYAGLLSDESLSEPDDVRLMRRAITDIHNQATQINAGEAGTVMRFITALAAVKGYQGVITGSERMKARPIEPMVSALNSLGFNISYLENYGYPPLQVHKPKGNIGNLVHLQADISSQYISALMLVGAALPEGLTLKTSGNRISSSYLNLTAETLRASGIKVQMGEDIMIQPDASTTRLIESEADWSSAAYMLTMLSLVGKGKLIFPNLNFPSPQGDSFILSQLKNVRLNILENGIEAEAFNHSFELIDELDATNFPDLVQTLAVLAALKRNSVLFTGIKSLRIKETNRVQALKAELPKIGAILTEESEDSFTISPIENFTYQKVLIHTYNDHRMAMAFSLVAALYPVQIEKPEIVSKSFPGFFAEIEKSGVHIKAS